MNKTITPDQLSEAIQEELTVYSKDVTEKINEAGRKAVKKLVELTKSSAPVGERGKYSSSITSTEEAKSNGSKAFIWYVKGKESRLTHLLVHGHATKNGGRTKANPFLHDAVNTVLPEYEKAVEEAITK